MEKIICSLCNEKCDGFSRYKNMVCNDCINKYNCKDINGNVVTYCNQDISGGFISKHNENGLIIKKQDHICWINNIKCYACEARFGGIIIQKYDK